MTLENVLTGYINHMAGLHIQANMVGDSISEKKAKHFVKTASSSLGRTGTHLRPATCSYNRCTDVHHEGEITMMIQ